MAETPPINQPQRRIRMIFDTEERVRVAIHLRATKDGTGPSELLTNLVLENMADDVAEAEAAIRNRQTTPRVKRGRKPKRT